MLVVPRGASPEQAALSYLIHLGVASLRQVRYEAGENVVVVGLGVIGLCTVAVASVMGARVYAVSNSEERASLARRLGAVEARLTGTFEPASICGGEAAEIVVLTANPWDAWRESMEMAAHRGRISVLWFPGRAQAPPPFNPLDARWLYGKQLTICGAGFLPRVECAPGDIRFNLRRNLQYILDLLGSGRLDVEPVISHRFPYTQMRDAYELAARHSKDFSAAVFDWRSAHAQSRR
jgi:threonine dehydrogenase-like Zn-dependent dehydrogenase